MPWISFFIMILRRTSLAIRAVSLQPPRSQDMGRGYALQVQLDWDSLAQFQHGYEMTSEVLMADIDSFSNTKPLIMTGDVILERQVQAVRLD